MQLTRNQAPPLAGYNLFAQDRPLAEALRREGGGAYEEQVTAFGEALGGEPLEWGRLANEHPPKLRTHDRYGERIDEVEFHPAWDSLLGLGLEARVHSLPWVDPRPGAHVARAALFTLLGQVEAGVCCPLSMTFAAVPVLRAQPDFGDWVARLTSGGALCGMAMTERQGGSDVRTNETTAEPAGDTWELHGHKWFCSAPMSDVFLVLAQAPAGLSCFLVERPQPGFQIDRLKDKLGNRSNASAEIRLEGAVGRLVGEEGRGVATILEMVNHTRLDCVLGSTALQRCAVAEASHHTAHRSAFGRVLAEQPLMENVLADLAVESEASTVTALRLARAWDEGDQAFSRLATAVCKFWICKRTPAHVAEALECLGGNGYVEESHLPRLFRESPLNSIWEGSGNVNALDVLRALDREPETVAAFVAEVELAAGADRRLDTAVARLKDELADTSEPEPRARRLVERLALALQGSLLVRHGDPAVADAFCASRLCDGGSVYGTLPAGLDLREIVDRHRPRLPLMTQRRLASLLCTLLVLAGCGGGASASEYREQAEEICASATREAAEVAPPSDDAASVAGYGDAVAEIRERETVALDELEPPEELEAGHGRLVNASAAIVRSLNDLARAAERDDRTAAAAAAALGGRAADQARRAAAELELPSCGQPGQAP